ncbi:hypothetical protein B5807_01965 [Epicoccum nigrum]|uniref:Uncharacterized protein n=1 Tax=Epicoccum nigrum TaxID=105696 RepID=A0A1Y2MAL2_EPING|nr:hypothetical protein B5807_01965 [Epicoccum nigrum]
MSPSSRVAIRFVIAFFLAQTFVNAVAVPHPHIHKVLDPRQVVSLPVIERQEPTETPHTNVFDDIVNLFRNSNGWQVVQDFFKKLFGGSSNNGNTGNPTVTIVPTPGASATPIDVISAIFSMVSEAVTATDSFTVALPSPTTESDGIMSILPIYPITTAIELFPAEEPSVPSDLISELVSGASSAGPVPTDIPIVVVVPPVEANSTALPGSTDVPVIVVIPPVEANSTDVSIALPVGTAPIVTGPVVVAPIATGTPLFPLENGTSVVPLPGTEVPVIVIVPTGISSPIEANASASVGFDVTVSLTTTLGVTVTVDPIDIGTVIPSVGTGLPITLSEAGPYANATTISPTLVFLTGTGDVGTISPTAIIEPISAPFANATTAIASIGTGTGIIIIGTAVPSIPVSTIVLGTGTGIDDATAVLPIGTDLPAFPNTTSIEVVVQPTVILGTAPAVTISGALVVSDVAGAIYANTTTVTVTNFITPSGFVPEVTALPVETDVDTAAAPAGTIIIVQGPGAVLPNATLTVTTDATISIALPVEVTDVPPILPAEPTELPSILPAPVVNGTDLAPLAPVSTEFPALPLETVEPIIVEPVPSDVPVVELPGEPLIPTLPTPVDTALPFDTALPAPSILPLEETPGPAPVDSTIPIVPLESLVPVASAPTTTIEVPVPALTLDAGADTTALPVVPVVPVQASAAAAVSAGVGVAAVPVLPTPPLPPLPALLAPVVSAVVQPVNALVGGGRSPPQ